jgi:large-conductance mechanosensitive channel
MPDDALPQDPALKKLRDKTLDLDQRLGTDPQGAPGAQVAIVAGLSAEVIASRIAGFSASVTSFGDASAKHTRALVRWTKVLAVATVFLVIATAVLALVTARPAMLAGFGARNDESRDAAASTQAVGDRLRGLKQLALESDGAAITPALLAEVHAQLEAAGLQVTERSQFQTAQGQPLLHLDVEANPFAPKDAPVWAVGISLRERVVLQRSSAVAFDTETWSLKTVRNGDVAPAVRNSIGQFVAAYRAANGH